MGCKKDSTCLFLQAKFATSTFKIWGCMCTLCIPSSAVPDLNNEATIFSLFWGYGCTFNYLQVKHSAVSRWESIFYHQTLFEVDFNILSTLVFTKTKSKLILLNDKRHLTKNVDLGWKVKSNFIKDLIPSMFISARTGRKTGVWAMGWSAVLWESVAITHQSGSSKCA